MLLVLLVPAGNHQNVGRGQHREDKRLHNRGEDSEHHDRELKGQHLRSEEDQRTQQGELQDDSLLSEDVPEETDGERERFGQLTDDVQRKHQGGQPERLAHVVPDVAPETVLADTLDLNVRDGHESQRDGHVQGGGGRLETRDKPHQVHCEDEQERRHQKRDVALPSRSQDPGIEGLEPADQQLQEVLKPAGHLLKIPGPQGSEDDEESHRERGHPHVKPGAAVHQAAAVVFLAVTMLRTVAGAGVRDLRGSRPVRLNGCRGIGRTGDRYQKHRQAGEKPEKQNPSPVRPPFSALRIVASCLVQPVSFRRATARKSACQRIYHNNGLGVSQADRKRRQMQPVPQEGNLEHGCDQDEPAAQDECPPRTPAAPGTCARRGAALHRRPDDESGGLPDEQETDRADRASRQEADRGPGACQRQGEHTGGESPGPPDAPEPVPENVQHPSSPRLPGEPDDQPEHLVKPCRHSQEGEQKHQVRSGPQLAVQPGAKEVTDARRHDERDAHRAGHSQLREPLPVFSVTHGRAPGHRDGLPFARGPARACEKRRTVRV
jgi:hypothetical protein